MNTGFRVRNNETRKFVDGRFCLGGGGVLFDADEFDSTKWNDISDTHTAQFPVGQQDKNGNEIYEGDKLDIGFETPSTATLRGIAYSDGSGIEPWDDNDDFHFITIEPPKLTWPDLEDGTFFCFTDNENLIYIKMTSRFFIVDGGKFGMEKYNCNIHEVTVVVPDWKEEKA